MNPRKNTLKKSQRQKNLKSENELKWWNRLFGKKKSDRPDKSPYLPKEKVPKELEFAEKFTERGGFFIYCENRKEVLENFTYILKENRWSKEDVLCFDENLATVFDLPHSKQDQKTTSINVGLFLCEYLISNTGSILFCHHQTKHLKMNQLPKTLVVYAAGNQFVSDVSEGMTKLKTKYNRKIPTNIRTINCEDNKQIEGDSFSTNTSKSIYLLLQDDLF